MTDNVIRFPDPERRSREADAAAPRNPADADVIILPVIRRFNDPPLEMRVVGSGQL